jgi:putative NIF3 family GTP cyclohydrolase 1 type 2
MIAPTGRVDAVVAALVAAHPYEEPAYDVYEVRANAGFIGRVGTVDRTTAGALGERLRASLRCEPRIAGSDRGVERVAVVPGSGRSFIAAAAEIADAVITGDVSHHDAQDALGRGLAVIDVGHVPGERPGVARLYALISQLGIPVRNLTELDPDPWS